MANKVSILRKRWSVYVLLAVAWLVMVGWLVFEHDRVREIAHEGIVNQARNVSDTIALISRSGRFGMIQQERLEEALAEMIEQGQLISVALLNSSGEVIVQAGPPLPVTLDEIPADGTLQLPDSMIVYNPVDFGSAVSDAGTTRPPTMVIPSVRYDESGQPIPDERDDRREEGPQGPGWAGEPQRGGDGRPGPGWGGEPQRGGDGPQGPGWGGEPQRGGGWEGGRGGRGGDRPGMAGVPRTAPMNFPRPRWLQPDDYIELLAKQGLHGFILELPTALTDAEIERDFWLRFLLAMLGAVALGGIGLAWRNLESSTRLQMRLVRAHELNTHLQEMNIAAAGLAHETRNPLNIVRGLAHLIATSPAVSEDIRNHSRHITEEVDRVTVRLNEFINYSRPPEPRLTPTPVLSVASDVARALESDLADKQVTIETVGPDRTVMADEPLLRQVLFNLLLNAIQSTGDNGIVRVRLQDDRRGELSLAIEDNGPGVPEELKEEIFRPYFTTRDQGSGLGLAVVKQIVLAHGWEIHYVRNEMGGATFMITNIKSTERRSPAA